MATEAQIRDKWWRLNNLYHIVDKAGRKVRFTPNWAQDQLYREMWFLNVILKARQLGMTTFICLYFLDACLWNSNTHAGIIAHNLEDAQSFFANKIKFAYDALPETMKDVFKARTDRARELVFENGSSIRVGTSMRSATLQLLHISEFGKVCAKFPDRAREIVTGALNTVQAGQQVFVESTAEGREGHFYTMCMDAQNAALQGKPLSRLDFKFFFFPWWKEPAYALDPATVLITDEHRKYFDELELKEGIVLTPDQQAWFVSKARTQGKDMKREYPSTPKEAFEASIEGAYYSTQMAFIRKEGRIGKVPYEPALPVNVFWDLGMDDETVLWFHQRYGKENRFIDYYEGSNEGLRHYVNVLFRKPYVYNTMVLPHDIKVRSLSTGEKRLETLQSLLASPTIHLIVCPRHEVVDGIEAVRNFLPLCWFDEQKCAQGIAALDAYQHEWDDKIGGFKNKPLHNWASHAADAMRVGVMGYHPPRARGSRRWPGNRSAMAV